jgi:hypothetical protein
MIGRLIINKKYLEKIFIIIQLGYTFFLKGIMREKERTETGSAKSGDSNFKYP